jgi:accessory colonization factor AcfC
MRKIAAVILVTAFVAAATAQAQNVRVYKGGGGPTAFEAQ